MELLIRLYKNEPELEENEYLFKMRERDSMGFLAKPNKGDKLPPKKFRDWGHRYCDDKREPCQIFIVEQTLCKGWKVEDYRRGESADWVRVIHPDGYKLEIKTVDFFFDLLPNININRGKIKEPLIWKNGELKLKK